MNLKPLAFFGLSLVASVSAQAGFYAGGTVGFGSIALDNSAIADGNDGSNFSFGKKGSKSRFVFGALAGYSFDLSPCAFLSPEFYALFVNAAQSSEKDVNSTDGDFLCKTAAKVQAVLGGALRVGYRMSSGFTPFGKIGLELAQVKTKGEILLDGDLVDGSKFDQSNWKPGFSIGAGAEQKMGGVILRGEYTFSTFKGTGAKVLKDNDDDGLYTHQLKGVKSHKFMISAVVPFGK